MPKGVTVAMEPSDRTKKAWSRSVVPYALGHTYSNSNGVSGHIGP
jgi:hypothetical protein